MSEETTSPGTEPEAEKPEIIQVQQLENIDIGIHALAPIPVGADENNHGESDLPVNFGGVTFFPEDYIYADLTGIILSQEALDLEDFEEE